MVARIPERGVLVKQAGKVDPDPQTGQLTTIFDDLPQLPFSHFGLHFRDGARAPLVTPPACGTYDRQRPLRPLVGPTPTTRLPRDRHPHLLPDRTRPRRRPLPQRRPAALPPRPPRRHHQQRRRLLLPLQRPPHPQRLRTGDHPLLDQAAARDRRQARRHPLLLRRRDRRRRLPAPAPTAAPKSSTTPPARPPRQVGRTLAGAGVGPSLAYAPGKVYLAGPYHGAPISFVSITAGVVGPFDIGTVVVRLALKVNPETGEVFLDSTGSDPIPHIIKGIPSTCATSAPTPTAPSSPSTRPAANRPRPRDGARLRPRLRPRRRRQPVRLHLALPGRRLRRPALQAEADA